jgi:hypothetical protein
MRTTTSPGPLSLSGRVRYVGVRDASGSHVWVERDGTRRPIDTDDDEPAMPLAWSLTGPGASTLARLVLRDATGSPALAGRFYRRMTFDVIARLPPHRFEMTGEDVIRWLEGLDGA